MPIHSMTCAHPSWLDRTSKRSFIVAGFSPERFLVSVFHASEKFDSDLELDAGMHKTDAHPCPPMNNNIAPMPTQNPWARVGMGMDTQCKVLLPCDFNHKLRTYLNLVFSLFTTAANDYSMAIQVDCCAADFVM